MAMILILVVLTASFSSLPNRLSRLLLVTGVRQAQARPDAQRRQQQRRLTAAEVVQLVIEYQAGADMNVLAARWQLHRATVATHLAQAGVSTRRQGIPDTRVHELVRLYAEGWSCARLAERYDCVDETVRQTLKRAGVKLRTPWERV